MAVTTWHDARQKPLTLLLTTTACVADLARHLGSADYSYGFVWRGLEPVLSQLGEVHLVDRPESRLSHAAAQVRRAERVPVHIALLPPHLAYFPADVPTILFPFWEFPEIPDRAFAHDTRQDWTITARGSRHIVTACEFTARAFRRSRLSNPVTVIPVPLDPACFDVAPWNPRSSWTHECRHIELGSSGRPETHLEEPASEGCSLRRSWKQSLCRAYGRCLRPWLSDKTLHRARRFRQKVLRIPDVPPPLLPRRQLMLSGLVYLSVFNFSDRRKNPRDLLTAFLTTFRDRNDVSLVLKLATNPQTEHDEVRQLVEMYQSFGLAHRCRLIAITDYLEPSVLRGLHGAAAFYVNTSKAEGACLPLQEALAAGRPAIAPDHTAMADYLDPEVGFPIHSSPEPTAWPHDPSQRSSTTWARLSWSSLSDRLRESAEVALHDRRRYERLASAARARMQSFASRDVVRAAWRELLLSVRGDQTLAA
jgi:glycosyltransferase involved in cell wall biosynthesis